MMVAAMGRMHWLPPVLAQQLLARGAGQLVAAASADDASRTPAALAAFAAGLLGWHQLQRRRRRQQGRQSRALEQRRRPILSTPAGRGFSAAWLTACEQQLASCNAKQAIMIGITTSCLRLEATDSWRAAWLAAAAPHLGRLDERQVITVLTLAARLRLHLPAAWCSLALEQTRANLMHYRRQRMRSLRAAAHVLHARGVLSEGQLQEARLQWRLWLQLHHWHQLAPVGIPAGASNATGT